MNFYKEKQQQQQQKLHESINAALVSLKFQLQLRLHFQENPYWTGRMLKEGFSICPKIGTVILNQK